jgi:hypothetical protein
MNRAVRRPPLFLQCAVSAFLFLFLSPGFALQYLAWLVPWVVAAGPLAALLFYGTSGELLYRMYIGQLEWNSTTQRLTLICWLSVGIVLAVLIWRASARIAAPARRPAWTDRIRFAGRCALAGAVVLLVLFGLARAKAGPMLARFSRPFVVATSSYGQGVPFPPAGAVDGRSDAHAWEDHGGWNSERTPSEDNPEFLTFFFPAQRALRAITLFAYPEPRFTLKSFVFQVRADGEWQDIEETRVRDNTDAVRWAFEFPPRLTRQVRLLIFGAADAYARVMEVEFVDANAVAPDP